jgi:hypothetical protein
MSDNAQPYTLDEIFELLRSGRLRTRDGLYDLLRENNFPLGRSTLDKLCMPSRGEGPPVAAWWPGRGGDRPLYETTTSLDWAKNLLKPGASHAQTAA